MVRDVNHIQSQRVRWYTFKDGFNFVLLLLSHKDPFLPLITGKYISNMDRIREKVSTKKFLMVQNMRVEKREEEEMYF